MRISEGRMSPHFDNTQAMVFLSLVWRQWYIFSWRSIIVSKCMCGLWNLTNFARSKRVTWSCMENLTPIVSNSLWYRYRFIWWNIVRSTDRVKKLHPSGEVHLIWWEVCRDTGAEYSSPDKHVTRYALCPIANLVSFVINLVTDIDHLASHSVSFYCVSYTTLLSF